MLEKTSRHIWPFVSAFLTQAIMRHKALQPHRPKDRSGSQWGLGLQIWLWLWSVVESMYALIITNTYFCRGPLSVIVLSRNRVDRQRTFHTRPRVVGDTKDAMYARHCRARYFPVHCAPKVKKRPTWKRRYIQNGRFIHNLSVARNALV